jgi:hypothetical protein
MPAAGGERDAGVGIEVLGVAMASGHSWLHAASLRAIAAACGRRQPAVSRLAFRVLLVAAIGLALDCYLLKGWSAEIPTLAAAALETPQLMTGGGDGGISFPFQAPSSKSSPPAARRQPS